MKMSASLMCLTSSWRNKLDEYKSTVYARILRGAAWIPAECLGVARLQNSSEWTVLHPVIMKVPLALAEKSGAEKVKGLSRFAREALKLSAERSNVTPREPEKDAHGVPQPTNGLYWSLSHTLDFVAAVVAPYAIGIDIEEIKDVSIPLKERVASEVEWQLAPKNDPTVFFRYWTAKEAVLKAVGHGLSGLDHCTVTQIIDDTRILLSYRDSSWLVLQHKVAENKPMGLSGYLAAITLGCHEVVWEVVG